MDIFDKLIDTYGKIEVAKAEANANGKEHTQQKLTVERPNAAAVQVESSAPATQSQRAAKPGSTVNIAGMQVNKMLLLGSGALLVGALAMRFMKK